MTDPNDAMPRTGHSALMIEDDDVQPPRLSCGALFLRFLRFGAMAFGGPVAQIAMVRRELVEQEGWISGPRFNRLLAVMQVLPGPEAHELCVHLGMRAKGRLGGLLAGLGFMLPGFLLMTLAAWAYFRFDVDSGWTGAMLIGAQAAVVALVIRAVHRIGRHVFVDVWLWAIGGMAALATLIDVPFWAVLIAGAFTLELVRLGQKAAGAGVLALFILCALGWALLSPGAEPPQTVALPGPGATWLLLFIAGLKGGLLTFGGAYTAIPFVRQDLVGRGWIADATFMDGLSLANVLPAPLVVFATFSGYAAGGFAGAVAITVGMFLPAFAFSMIFYERLETLVSDPRLRAALDGMAAAVVGIIAATVISLAAGLQNADRPLALFVMMAASLAALYVFNGRFVAPLVLLAAGAAGLILSWA